MEARKRTVAEFIRFNARLKYAFVNNQRYIQPFSFLPDECDHMMDDVVYEVIKVIKGKPFQFEEHFDRLQRSVESRHADIITADVGGVKRNFFSCVRANPAHVVQNVQVLYWIGARFPGGKKPPSLGSLAAYGQTHHRVADAVKKGRISWGPNYAAFYRDSSYPSNQTYDRGVRAAFFEQEREEPNEKIWRETYKARVSRAIEENNVTEVLLVNSKNRVTEGSKSNFFMVSADGHGLVTAPDESVLLGTTRIEVLKFCEENFIPVEFREPTPQEICQSKGCFVTGTSIHVLPISEIVVLPELATVVEHSEARERLEHYHTDGKDNYVIKLDSPNNDMIKLLMSTRAV